MSASDITDYSSEVEELFIRYMISKPDLYVRCKGILRAEYFDDNFFKKSKGEVLNEFNRILKYTLGEGTYSALI